MTEDAKPTEAVAPPTGEKVQSQQNIDAQGQFNAAVDELLDQLQHKFDNVSRDMFGKLDDMAHRLDDLEASLTSVTDDAATATPAK
ncbi:heat shock factor-binding 1 family protein [Aspergillus chevalieri]|uniref:Heat shock factor binding protein 1-domain-containing protein n=1 Tax=Aspergillus chevalieri TaxID=182096 RepID=A0A7R7VQ90_ASPCH|nr:uncharacterized protein ACHE_41251A [Aspergillus chevalieri]BCR88687.1 hypothetical protein ACHE_41251A [Aspergillus chevalieri]